MKKIENLIMGKKTFWAGLGRAVLFGPVILVLHFCREPYVPPAIQNPPAYLVVDGYLNGSQDSTVIRLTRTRNLDSLSTVPELGAQVTVTGDDSSVHPLFEEGNGYYSSPQLGLNTNMNYRLRIMTANGESFQSDTVSVRVTPAIDSVFWRNDSSGVGIYVNTHDPMNSTWYYRWDYVETWQYHSDVMSPALWVNDQLVIRSPAEQIYTCYTTIYSSSINVATSARLSQDIISNYQLVQIPMGDEKLNREYSILVKQYAITSDAYSYWENLKQNTEQVGGLFDPQPSQLTGNIHCLSNPKETVLGYIGASTVSAQRIFINYQDVTQPWGYIPYYVAFADGSCGLLLFSQADMVQNFDVPGPPQYCIYGTPTGAPGFLVVPSQCADCRIHGGSNVKPSYWPF
jgi:hypothetical protein